MPNQEAQPAGIYLHDKGRSICIQVCGPLEGAMVPELLQLWKTSCSIRQRTFVVDLKAAAPVSAEGMEALDLLRAAGVQVLWPDDANRSTRRRPLLSVLRNLFCETVF
jgi:hypothetical protein